VYCQDNELSWVDWDLDKDQMGLLDFTRRLVELRSEHPVFRRRRFFAGNANHGGESELGDIAWFTPGGQHMSEEDWANGYARSLMVFFNGMAIPEPNPRGGPTDYDSFLVVFNAHHESIKFTLPPKAYGATWTVVVDTATDAPVSDKPLRPRSKLTVEARSVVVLQSPREASE
jgi:glycogen operon protein